VSRGGRDEHAGNHVHVVRIERLRRHTDHLRAGVEDEGVGGQRRDADGAVVHIQQMLLRVALGSAVREHGLRHHDAAALQDGEILRLPGVEMIAERHGLLDEETLERPLAQVELVNRAAIIFVDETHRRAADEKLHGRSRHFHHSSPFRKSPSRIRRETEVLSLLHQKCLTLSSCEPPVNPGGDFFPKIC
jgi:hypothetical protein